MKLSALAIKSLQSIPRVAYVDIRMYLGYPWQEAFAVCIVPDDDYSRCGKKGDAKAYGYSLVQAIGEAFVLSKMERGENPFIPDAQALIARLNTLPENICLVTGWDGDGTCFARVDDNIWLVDEWGYHFGYGSAENHFSKTVSDYPTLLAAIETVL